MRRGRRLHDVVRTVGHQAALDQPLDGLADFRPAGFRESELSRDHARLDGSKVGGLDVIEQQQFEIGEIHNVQFRAVGQVPVTSLRKGCPRP